jgi:hypothetical protein
VKSEISVHHHLEIVFQLDDRRQPSVFLDRRECAGKSGATGEVRERVDAGLGGLFQRAATSSVE